MTRNLLDTIRRGAWHHQTIVYAEKLGALWEGEAPRPFWVDHLIEYEKAHGLRPRLRARARRRSAIQAVREMREEDNGTDED